MKFVFTQAVCPEGMQLLPDGADVYVANDRDPNHYLGEMQDADAIVVRIATMDANAIAGSPNLKVIGRTGVGYDNVDVKAATARGIPVVITPGANSLSVAEHAVALMFALAKNLVESHCETLRGNYEIRGSGKAFELAGKTVAILGLGAIGQHVARLCRALGMRTIGYDPYLEEAQTLALCDAYCADYRDALPQCDFLTLHVPLTAQTRNMIDAAAIGSMKPGAMIVNCARGGVVDERALTEALQCGRIGGAGIDCFEQEPPAVDNELLNAPNVIVTPHSAAQTKEAVVNMATLCIQGCLAVARGEKWPHVADPSVWEHPKWKTK